ncbi:hypothetical protein J2X65_004248 [Ancylobacter sp. 3268]|uniref:hypothetical protein n=1 Tax=Ancylobacter sp. 3268 TaxID=2817752 RepID=UPI002867A0CB|nr:hypothetical protein [Ancylobacter sp. 3268]MDR6954872.1 hypothetical protein [Ancylobacter sp. 3268]
MATSDQLRTEIDRGRAGDKVPFRDPAAAPLGTDDEAAGLPTMDTVDRARDQETSATSHHLPAVTHEASRGFDDNRGGGSVMPFVVRVVVWLAAIVALGGMAVAWLFA